MKKDLKIILLAYPDNPAGRVFLNRFKENQIPVSIIIETQSAKTTWKRLKSKIAKDGVSASVKRILNIFFVKLVGSDLISESEKLGIPVYTVEKFNSSVCSELLKKLSPDLLVIVSAPILKPAIFEKAKIGCLNAHPGWLPAYRGIGANAWALHAGDSPGISVHFIDHEIDKGIILDRKKVPFTRKDTAAKINDRAIEMGAEMICDTIKKIADGQCTPPDINEPHGDHYRAMPYKQVKKVNRMIRRGKLHAI